jgi:hypothetical protein
VRLILSCRFPYKLKKQNGEDGDGWRWRSPRPFSLKMVRLVERASRKMFHRAVVVSKNRGPGQMEEINFSHIL